MSLTPPQCLTSLEKPAKDSSTSTFASMTSPYIEAKETHAAATPVLLKQRVLIVGSTGRMGIFFLHRLKAANISVTGIDIPYETSDMTKACAAADIVLLCVPAKVLEDVVRSLQAYIPPTAILADITSVKVQPMEQMHKLWQGPIVGTHPLFGPGSHKGLPMPVAIVGGENSTEQHICSLEHIFTAIGCNTFRCSAQQHDKAMAAIQNLNFITSLAYFAALAPLSEDEDILPFLTPSFRRRQDAARRMLTEDAQLFTGLFEANPYSHEMVRKYRAFLNIAAGGDIDLLTQKAAWWWE